MAERAVVLDEPEVSAEALQQANERAERAEAELARLKHRTVRPPADTTDAQTELRKDSMMAHLLDSLADGQDIGHYGRLVFAMVARHFMPHDDVLAWLMRDQDFSDEQARLMLRQVEGRDYNPPRRERILEWQAQQDFPILPDVNDPNCGNLYRNLKFPEHVYEGIGHYQEARMEAEGS